MAKLEIKNETGDLPNFEFVERIRKEIYERIEQQQQKRDNQRKKGNS